MSEFAPASALRAPRQGRERALDEGAHEMCERIGNGEAARQLASVAGGACDGRVFYIVDPEASAPRPLARFTDAADAHRAAAAFESLGLRATLLSRDECPERPRPSLWRVEYASPARRAR